MSELRRTPIQVGGRKGMIVHDKLCADGPVDPETGKPLIDPETGEPYDGPNDDMANLLHDYLVKMRSLVNVKDAPSAMPRFGVLSLLAMHTPIYVYDHPAFKEVANTAFTDGINVFIDADFMRKLVKQEEDCDGKKSGVLWTICHELFHKLLYHVDRLKNFPPDIANIAEDYVINGKLIKAFPTLQPVDLLMELCVGVRPEEADKFYKMAEEVVAETLLIQERKKQKEQKQKQQGGGGGGQGGGQPGDDESDGQQNDQQNSQGGNKQGKGNGKQDKNGKGGDKGEPTDSQGNGYSPIHHITPEELLDIIEKNGLQGSVGKALNLPSKDDVEGIGKMKAKAKLNDIDAVQTAISQAAQCNGNYPGQHIAEHAQDVIGDLDKGKIIWKLAIKKHVMGDGQKLHKNDDEAHMIMYMDKGTLGFDPFYDGALVPVASDETVLVLVDTSGSTSGGTMRKEFLQECLGIKRSVSSMGDAARKVIMFSADTVLRGEPIEITDANVESLRHDGVPIFGNGGTSFKSCLDEALGLPQMKKEKVKTVIYFTDCLDNPPTRADFEEHLNKGIKIVFVTTPGMWNEKWNNDVGSFAEVYCIEDGTVANLDKDAVETNTRRHSMA